MFASIASFFSFRRPLLFAALLALVPLAHPAHAQLTFIADTDAHPMLGPAAATGAVIWSHGRSVDSEDSRAPTPDYIEAFRNQGWDAFRLNRMRVSDTLEASSNALAEIAARLKEEGYRRVVLAGQSFGAFVSLIAADHSDNVDAVIATAPAAYGTVADNPRWGALNATNLYPLLQHIRHARVMLFYFQGDVFDPGGRGPASDAILTSRDLPHLVIDRPERFSTHWAASTAQFARTFGPCITAFAADDHAEGELTCRAVERIEAKAAPTTAPAADTTAATPGAPSAVAAGSGTTAR